MSAADGVFADVVAHLRHVHGLADEEALALEAAQLLEELLSMAMVPPIRSTMFLVMDMLRPVP